MFKNFYYVWVSDECADDGRRSWIVNADTDMEAKLEVSFQSNDNLDDLNVHQLFLFGNSIEVIQA